MGELATEWNVPRLRIQKLAPPISDQNLGRLIVDIIIPWSFGAFQNYCDITHNFMLLCIYTPFFQLKVVDTNGGGTLSMTEAKKIAFVSKLSLLWLVFCRVCFDKFYGLRRSNFTCYDEIIASQLPIHILKFTNNKTFN